MRSIVVDRLAGPTRAHTIAHGGRPGPGRLGLPLRAPKATQREPLRPLAMIRVPSRRSIHPRVECVKKASGIDRGTTPSVRCDSSPPNLSSAQLIRAAARPRAGLDFEVLYPVADRLLYAHTTPVFFVVCLIRGHHAYAHTHIHRAGQSAHAPSKHGVGVVIECVVERRGVERSSGTSFDESIWLWTQARSVSSYTPFRSALPPIQRQQQLARLQQHLLEGKYTDTTIRVRVASGQQQ